MPEEKKDANANAAGAATGNSGGGIAASKYSLPAELNGKSAEEVGAWYNQQSERYKDYDNVKSRADKYGEYEALNLSPDQIKGVNKWMTDMLAGMSSGKAPVLRDNGKRVEWIEIPSGAPPQAQAQQAQWNADWEMADPSQQAERLAAHVWNDLLSPKVTETINGYNQQHQQALQQFDQKFGLFMDALEQWQANPTKLNIREVLARANQMMTTNPGDYIKMAAEQIMTPAQQEQAIQEQVAAKMAEFQQKWENDHKPAPIVPRPLGGSRHGEARPKNLNEARQAFMKQLREMA